MGDSAVNKHFQIWCQPFMVKRIMVDHHHQALPLQYHYTQSSSILVLSVSWEQAGCFQDSNERTKKWRFAAVFGGTSGCRFCLKSLRVLHSFGITKSDLKWSHPTCPSMCPSLVVPFSTPELSQVPIIAKFHLLSAGWYPWIQGYSFVEPDSVADTPFNAWFPMVRDGQRIAIMMIHQSHFIDIYSG